MYAARSAMPLPPVFLTSLHACSMGRGSGSSAPASAAWSATNRIVYVPFYVSEPITIYRYFWLNGATASTDNLQVGVYRSDFTQIHEGTSTTATGANICQFDNITAYGLGAGRYYMALWGSGTTTTVFRVSSINIPGMGIYFETNAGGLPATGAPADPASTTGGTVIPMFGLALRATDP